MGSKGSGSNATTQQQSQNQVQSYTADPLVKQYGYQALGQAGSVASQPFQMPVAPVAGFSPLQQQAFNQYQALQGTAQPYFDVSKGLYQQSAAPITAADVNNYYNPMAANVTANLQDIFGQQNSQNTANLIQAAGGIGADRIAVGQANMAKQQGLAAGQTYANLYQQALQAAQAQKGMEAGAAGGISGLGTAAQNAALQGTSALYGAGTSQQQQQQAELNAPYQNILARLAYPFQSAQYLAGITGGLAPALGGVTQGQNFGTSFSTPPTPSLASQILGIGAAGIGAYGALGGNFGGSGSPAWGGGNFFSGDAYGGNSANPLPGLTAADYGPGYADGGGVEDQPIDVTKDQMIPNVPFTGGNPQSHFAPMQFSQPQIQQPQPQSGGSDIGSTIGKVASTVLPIALSFLKDGGSVKGYDDGGPIPTLGWGGPPFPGPTAPIDATSPITAPPPPPAFGAGAGPVAYPGLTNIPSLPPQPPARPAPIPAPRRAVSAGAPAAVNAGNDYTMPQEQLPYPDALNRDWGQNATRSPWMALVEAGATMAATPGSLGQALGKGVLAGAQSLDKQRGELRSEQQLNDKAKELYIRAQEHLDKYNKMTPYERGSLAARNREIDQSEEGVPGKPGKFTGADYDRAAKFVQSMNPGLPPEQLQPLIDAEISRRRAALARATSAAGAISDTIPIGTPKQFDDGKGGTVTGYWNGTTYVPKAP